MRRGEAAQEDGRVVVAAAALRHGVAATGMREMFVAAAQQSCLDFMEAGRSQGGRSEGCFFQGFRVRMLRKRAWISMMLCRLGGFLL